MATYNYRGDRLASPPPAAPAPAGGDIEAEIAALEAEAARLEQGAAAPAPAAPAPGAAPAPAAQPPVAPTADWMGAPSGPGAYPIGDATPEPTGEFMTALKARGVDWATWQTWSTAKRQTLLGKYVDDRAIREKWSDEQKAAALAQAAPVYVHAGFGGTKPKEGGIRTTVGNAVGTAQQAVQLAGQILMAPMDVLAFKANSLIKGEQQATAEMIADARMHGGAGGDLAARMLEDTLRAKGSLSAMDVAMGSMAAVDRNWADVRSWVDSVKSPAERDMIAQVREAIADGDIAAVGSIYARNPGSAVGQAIESLGPSVVGAFATGGASAAASAMAMAKLTAKFGVKTTGTAAKVVPIAVRGGGTIGTAAGVYGTQNAAEIRADQVNRGVQVTGDDINAMQAASLAVGALTGLSSFIPGVDKLVTSRAAGSVVPAGLKAAGLSGAGEALTEFAESGAESLVADIYKDGAPAPITSDMLARAGAAGAQGAVLGLASGTGLHLASGQPSAPAPAPAPAAPVDITEGMQTRTRQTAQEALNAMSPEVRAAIRTLSTSQDLDAVRAARDVLETSSAPDKWKVKARTLALELEGTQQIAQTQQAQQGVAPVQTEAVALPAPVVVSSAPAPAPVAPAPVAPAPAAQTAQLPPELRGAKPRYKTHELMFESDVDRAAYITRNQKKQSPRDSDYLSFVQQATGWTETEIRAHGDRVAQELKSRSANLPANSGLRLPTLGGTVAPRQSMESAPQAAPQAPVISEPNTAAQVQPVSVSVDQSPETEVADTGPEVEFNDGDFNDLADFLPEGVTLDDLNFLLPSDKEHLRDRLNEYWSGDGSDPRGVERALEAGFFNLNKAVDAIAAGAPVEKALRQRAKLAGLGLSDTARNTYWSTASTGTPMTLDSVIGVAREIMRNFPAGVQINVAQSWRDVPGLPDPGMTPAGVSVDGKVWIFAEGVTSPLDIEQTIAHELFHNAAARAADRVGSSAFTDAMLALYADSAWLRDEIQRWASNDADGKVANKALKDEAMSPAEFNVLAISEALARVAESARIGKLTDMVRGRSAVRRLLDWVAQLADQHGLVRLADWVRAAVPENQNSDVIDDKSIPAPVRDFVTRILKGLGDKGEVKQNAANVVRWSAADQSVPMDVASGHPGQMSLGEQSETGRNVDLSPWLTSFDSAVEAIVDQASNAAQMEVATRIRAAIQKLKAAGFQFTFNVTGEGRVLSSGARGVSIITMAGMGENTQIAVTVNHSSAGDQSGTNWTTVAHELAHAATQAAIEFAPEGSAAQQIRSLFNDVVRHFNARAGSGNMTPFEQRVFARQINALQNPHELVAWGLTNTDMQRYLDSIKIPRGSFLSRMFDAVASVLGFRANDTALAELLSLSSTLLTDVVDPYVAEANRRGKSYGLQADTSGTPSWALALADGKPVVWHAADAALIAAKSIRGNTIYLLATPVGMTRVDVGQYTGNLLPPERLRAVQAEALKLTQQTQQQSAQQVDFNVQASDNDPDALGLGLRTRDLDTMYLTKDGETAGVAIYDPGQEGWWFTYTLPDGTQDMDFQPVFAAPDSEDGARELEQIRSKFQSYVFPDGERGAAFMGSSRSGISPDAQLHTNPTLDRAGAINPKFNAVLGAIRARLGERMADWAGHTARTAVAMADSMAILDRVFPERTPLGLKLSDHLRQVGMGRAQAELTRSGLQTKSVYELQKDVDAKLASTGMSADFVGDWLYAQHTIHQGPAIRAKYARDQADRVNVDPTRMTFWELNGRWVPEGTPDAVLVRGPLAANRFIELMQTQLSPEQHQAMEALARSMSSLHHRVIDLEQDAGLYGPTVARNLKRQRYWVPLRNSDAVRPGNVLRKGRRTKAANPLVMSVALMQARTRRAYRNKAYQELLAAARSHLLPDVLTVNAIKLTAKSATQVGLGVDQREALRVASIFDDESDVQAFVDLVESGLPMEEAMIRWESMDPLGKDSLRVVERGVPYRMTINKNHPTGELLHRALVQDRDIQGMHRVVAAMTSATRVYSQLLTTANPRFTAIVQPIRDMLTVMFNVQGAMDRSGSPVAVGTAYKMSARIIKTAMTGIPARMRQAMNTGVDNRMRGLQQAEDLMKRIYDSEGGGLALGARLEFDQAQDMLRRDVSVGASAAGLRQTGQKVSDAVHRVMMYAHVFEEAMRYGTFVEFLKLHNNGQEFKTQAEFLAFKRARPDLVAAAVQASKEITTNFERRSVTGGSKLARGVIPFWNAAMQGVMFTIPSIVSTPQGRRSLAGLFAASLAMAFASIDDEEDKDLDGRSKYLRSPKLKTSWVIGGMAIPLPPELLSVHTAAVQFAASVTGNATPGEAGASMMGAAIGSISPLRLGQADDFTSILGMLPWFLQPPARVAAGVDAFGRPLQAQVYTPSIKKDGTRGADRRVDNPLDAETGRADTPEWIKGAAVALYQSAGIDWAPGSMDETIKGVTGSTYWLARDAAAVVGGSKPFTQAMFAPLVAKENAFAVSERYDQAVKDVLGGQRLNTPRGVPMMATAATNVLTKADEDIRGLKDAQGGTIASLSQAIGSTQDPLAKATLISRRDALFRERDRQRGLALQKLDALR